MTAYGSSGRKKSGGVSPLIQAIFDISPDALMAADSDGTILLANRATEELFGYTPEELAGKNVGMLAPSDMYDEYGKYIINYFDFKKTGKPERRSRIRAPKDTVALRKNGERFPVSIFVKETDHDGKKVFIGIIKDITHRKVAEDALRESEQKFRNAFEYAGIGMSINDLDGGYLRANRVFCEMLGYTEEELKRMSFMDITHPDDIAEDTGNVKKLINGEISHFSMDKRYRHKDGHTLWALLSVSLIRDAEGKPARLLAQMQDITERKRAELELLNMKKVINAILNAPSDTMLLIDSNDTILAINETAAHWFGKRPKEMTGENVYGFIPPELAAERKKIIDGVFKTGNPVCFEDERAGMIFETSVYPVFGEECSVVQVAIFARDITERRQKEKEILALARQNESMLNSAGEGILGLDSHGKHITANPSAVRMLGFTHAELIGNPSHEMWHHTKEDGSHYPVTECPIYAVYKDGNARRGEEIFWKKDGTPFPAEFTCTPMTEHGKVTGAVLLFQDISERKRAEKLQRERVEYIQIMQDITSACAEAATVNDAIQVVLDKVCGYTGWPIGHIYLPDESGTLASGGIWHIDEPDRFQLFREISEKTVFAPAEGLPGRVFDSGNPIWLNDVTATPWFVRSKLQPDMEIRAAFAFPVVQRNRVDAVLEFFSLRVTEPDEFMENMLALLTNQLGRVLERKRAEEELLVSQKRFDDIAKNSGDFIWEVDAEGRYTYASHMVEDILGYRPGQMLGQHFYDFFLSEDRETLKKAAFEVFASKQPFKNFLNRNLHKDGHVITLETSGVPILDARGNLRGYRGADRDVTERIIAEEKIREGRQKYEALVNNSSDVIYALSSAGKMAFMSRAVENITGYGFARFMETPNLLESLVLKDDLQKFKHAREEILNNPHSFNIEYRISRKDGSLAWINDRCTPAVDKKGEVEGYHGILADITKEKELEKLKEEFFQAVVHDLKSPLSGIKLELESITSYFDSIRTCVSEPYNLLLYENYESSVRNKIGNINDGLDRLYLMVLSLLKVGEMEEEKTSLRYESFNMAELMDELRDAFGSRMKIKNLSLEMKNGVTEDVICDRTLLKRVFQNLLDNALKFSLPFGEIQVEASCAAEDGDAECGKVLVSVSNRTLVMTKEKMDSMFHKFRTEDSPESGSGIGLFFCFKTMDLLGGGIYVDSDGDRIIFHVFFPNG